MWQASKRWPGRDEEKIGIGQSSSSRVLLGHLLTLDAIGKLVGVMQTDKLLSISFVPFAPPPLLTPTLPPVLAPAQTGYVQSSQRR